MSLSDLIHFNLSFRGEILQGEILNQYIKDFSDERGLIPQGVYFPIDQNSLLELIKFCYNHEISFNIVGQRSGKSGGYLLATQGILISLEHLKKIKYFEEDLIVYVESGVILGDLVSLLEEDYGVTFSVDPSSAAFCSVGGALAENAGGARGFKYGSMKQQVVGLDIITVEGKQISLGGRFRKNVTGYDLSSLIVGSEGTLAIIMGAYLKVHPLFSHKLMYFLACDSYDIGKSILYSCFKEGVYPSLFEFMDDQILKILSDIYPQYSDFLIGKHGGFLIEIEVHSIEEKNFFHQKCSFLFQSLTVRYQSLYDSQIQKEWMNIRRKISFFTKKFFQHKHSEDVVLPLSQVFNFLRALKEKRGWGEGIKILVFGHLGDGNLHINIVSQIKLLNDLWKAQISQILNEIFILVKRFEGTLSGEHGIGLTKKKHLNLFVSEKEISLYKDLKRIFDSKNLLNSGKIWLNEEKMNGKKESL